MTHHWTGETEQQPRSSVVEKTILGAWEAGRRFNVIVVDSRPLSEGERSWWTEACVLFRR